MLPSVEVAVVVPDFACESTVVTLVGALLVLFAESVCVVVTLKVCDAPLVVRARLIVTLPFSFFTLSA